VVVVVVLLLLPAEREFAGAACRCLSLLLVAS
jgi:hypothetical protein